MRLLVQQVHDVLLKNLPGADEPHRLLLLLDEFYQFGRMPEIVDRSPLVAGYGFQIAVIAQALTQFDVLYGRPTRDMMVGNMDVKLLIAAGDEVTAAYWSGELGKQYERREGWGTSTGARGGSRTRQGRWELQPIITSDAMGRLDPEKAVLLMRGHPGALIDKAFCLKEAGFKRQVQASEAFRSKLTIPMVGAAKQEPPTIAPVLKADPRRHEIAKARVQEAASTVFLDPRAFEAAFVQAMGEPQNEAIAQLCKLLRTTPETLGNFREEGRRRFRRETSPEARTLALRTEIIAARRALNDARAEFVMDAMVGPGPQSSVQPAPRDGVRPAEPVQLTPAPTAIAFSQMSMSEGSAAQRGKAPTDVMTAVEEIGVDVEGLSEAFRSMVSVGADESLNKSVSQLSEELEAEASLFSDTPDDLGEVMEE